LAGTLCGVLAEHRDRLFLAELVEQTDDERRAPCVTDGLADSGA
jgi:hypothetical protein